MRVKRLIVFYGLIYLVFSLWTYTQVEPNLVLSDRPWFWQIQQWFWALGYYNRTINAMIYLLMIMMLFGVYAKLIQHASKLTLYWRRYWLSLILILSLSYPALSHDVFNYAMNAKMVWKYGANPHVKVAQDFPNDPWLLYLHNSHTTAPYAYGWTVLSVIPGIIAGNHIKLSVWVFRGFMVLGFWLLIEAQRRLMPKENERWFLAFAFNPLVLIETVSNIHNDVVMMALALWSFILIKRARKKLNWQLVAGCLLFLASVSIKYATVMLLVGVAGMKWWPWLKQKFSFGGLLSLIQAVPLATTRSQRFLPWYLIWPLSFMPLSTNLGINLTLILFSLSSLLAYIPFLLTGIYSSQLLLLRSFIIFLPPLCFALSYILWLKLGGNHET